MRLSHQLLNIGASSLFILSSSLFANSLNNEIFSVFNLHSATGQCPFSVTGGPQLTKSLRIDAYNDSSPGCSVFSNQFWFLDTQSGTAISLPSGTYSFSNNPNGQQNLCNQSPAAHSFKISQVNSSGTIVSSSTCFVFTCSGNQITCTQTGTLALVNAS